MISPDATRNFVAIHVQNMKAGCSATLAITGLVLAANVSFAVEPILAKELAG